MKTLKVLIFLFSISCSVVNTIAQNVLIDSSGNPNEPSIMMDPRKPNILVAAANLNSYYLSSDAGYSWTEQKLTSSFGVWGDPCIDVDTSGNFYFFHLSNPSNGNWIDRIVCQRSNDIGTTWTDGSFMGLNGKKVQDKQWSVVDRTNNNIYVTWTQFDKYGSGKALDSSVILFSKSIDGGNTWSDAMRISAVAGDCLDGDNTVEGATPAVGPNGEIYVAWAGPQGLVFNRSLDEGKTWLKKEIFIDSMPGGWDYDIPGIYRANGLPVTVCDLSDCDTKGTIYVNWSDQRNGVDNTDVWLSKSTDRGDTWSDPIMVNNDGSNTHQFFTWMDIDQSNNNLYFVFYDRRNYTSNQTDVYLAVSKNGGSSFTNNRISESPFLPNAGIFFGDYTNIVAHNDTVRPIWTRLHEGKLSIWTDVTPVDQLLSSPVRSTNNEANTIAQYPNPASGMAYVSFKLHELSTINLDMYDQQGRLLHTAIDNEKMGYGTFIIPIDLIKLNVPAGTYYHKLTINQTTKILKTVIVP